MTDKEYLEVFTEGVKAAHESLEPLLIAFTDVLVEYESTLAPGQTTERLERLHEQLQAKGFKSEDENLN